MTGSFQNLKNDKYKQLQKMFKRNSNIIKFLDFEE